jgi:hypothetical protein
MAPGEGCRNLCDVLVASQFLMTELPSATRASAC